MVYDLFFGKKLEETLEEMLWEISKKKNDGGNFRETL